MLKYFDTNIFLYSTLNQGMEKQKLSTDLIDYSVENNELIISSLVMQEFVYGLAKNNLDKFTIKKIYDQFKTLIFSNHSQEIFEEAIELATALNYFRNINDCIHIKFAEKHCEKLITFDKDFEQFRPYTKLEIEILN